MDPSLIVDDLLTIPIEVGSFIIVPFRLKVLISFCIDNLINSLAWSPYSFLLSNRILAKSRFLFLSIEVSLGSNPQFLSGELSYRSLTGDSDLSKITVDFFTILFFGLTGYTKVAPFLKTLKSSLDFGETIVVYLLVLGLN